MFGWSKKEKNEKKVNQGRASMAKLSGKDRGKKLSSLRRRFPNYCGFGMFDFADELFDMDLIILYLLLSDTEAVEQADIYDNPEPDPIDEAIAEADAEPELEEMIEAAVVTDVVEEAVAEVESTPETVSFDSSTPVERAPVESTPDTTSFSSEDTSSYGGGGDSGGSYDSGGDSGGGDCGGD